MGEPMSLALLRAGFPVTVCAHRNRVRVERVLAAGAAEAHDYAELAGGCDVFVTCVPDAPQVEEVLFGPKGALGGAKPGTTFVDMSTVSPQASRSFDTRIRASGCRFIDAPMSGGPARAASGTLTIMAGALPEDFERVRPVLEAMGTPHRVGPPGLGETVKLVNQIIIANVMLANIEGVRFAQAAGAQMEAVRAVLATATASNYLLEQWLPKTLFTGRFEGGFALDLLRKDLGAALDAARALKLPMPASSLAYQLYTARSAQGDGALDYSAVAKFYEHNAAE